MGFHRAVLAGVVVGIAGCPLAAQSQCKFSETELENTVFDIESEGGLLYMSTQESGLNIVDVSDPARPVLIGEFTPGGAVHSVAVSGNAAYVVVLTSLEPLYELFILDMQNPAQPKVLGVFTIGDSARDVFVSGGTAFITRHDSLVSVDVSDPSSPMMLDELGGVTGYHGFAQGDTAYMTYNHRVRIVDVVDPRRLTLLADISTSASSRRSWYGGVAVVGDYLYLGSYGNRSPWHGLNIYDVNNPATPVHIGYARTPVGLSTLVVHEDQALSVTKDGEIASFDISNPAEPRYLGSRPMLGNGHGLAVAGEFVFAASDRTLFSYNIGASCEPCLADIDDNGSLDVQDFDHWLSAYVSYLCAADQNLNGIVEPSDFSAWVANFNRGCDF